jgi:Putative MetA-pathway of phenol degradation
VIKKLAPVLVFVSLAVSASAQTIDDGIMVAKRSLFTGDVYGHEAWAHYWEGALERENGNVGTVRTQTNVWYGDYGVTDRLNVIAMVPYVWTDASQGVLHGSQGFQDLTLAAKWNFLERPSTKAGALRTFAVLSAGIPLTDYNIELLRLSIGTGSSRFSGRFTANVQSGPGWYVNGSTAYTWRSSTTLDRPYFFTDDEFVMSDQVDMPNLFDYVLNLGYMKNGLNTNFAFTQQRTLGGGDIRRQDIPFASNRMNFTKVGGMVMYPVPKLRALASQFSYAYTATGRNVGQANSFTIGLLYTFNGRRSLTQ